MIDLMYSKILANNKKLKEDVNGDPYYISLLSNITVNPLIEIIEYASRLNNINSVVKIGNYDNIVQDSFVCKKSDLVVVFYDIYKIVNELPYYFEDISDALMSSLKSRIYNEFDLIFKNLQDSSAVVINTFSSQCFITDYAKQSKLDTFISDLNNYILSKEGNNISFINIDKIFSRISVEKAIDYRLYYSSKALYTISFFKHYVQALEPTLLKNTGKLKKAIIFDCDNTLWNGILGEDGMSGIDMSLASGKGFVFNKIQQIALFLSNNGVIVGLCSKNNEADVLEVLHDHPDMILKEDHIVIKKINWNDKASNLKEIAAELNIGEDSIVFVDDSDFEINLVKDKVPNIETVKVPTNLLDYENSLLKIVYKFFNFSLSDEDRQKTKMYKQQAQRSEIREVAGSIEDYLESLDIAIKVIENDETVIARISQMTQKTNQFNLTTHRYTENQVSNFIFNEDSSIFAISVSDKFGDNGITGLLICEFNKLSKSVTVDTFLMSCRVIGRNIEFVFFDFFITRIIEMGYSKIEASYIPTKKNEQVKELYENIGFEVVKIENGLKEYRLETTNYSKKEIDYIKIS